MLSSGIPIGLGESEMKHVPIERLVYRTPENYVRLQDVCRQHLLHRTSRYWSELTNINELLHMLGYTCKTKKVPGRGRETFVIHWFGPDDDVSRAREIIDSLEGDSTYASVSRV